jgi:hypothetical protein
MERKIGAGAGVGKHGEGVGRHALSGAGKMRDGTGGKLRARAGRPGTGGQRRGGRKCGQLAAGELGRSLASRWRS